MADAIPECNIFCVEYALLNQAVEEVVSVEGKDEGHKVLSKKRQQSLGYFLELLEKELNRANDFVTSKVKDIETRLSHVLRRAKDKNLSSSDQDDAVIMPVVTVVESLAAEILAIESCITHNMAAFTNIITKHDAYFKPTRSWLLARVEREAFCSQNFDRTLHLFSNVCAFLRQSSTGDTSEGCSPTTGVNVANGQKAGQNQARYMSSVSADASSSQGEHTSTQGTSSDPNVIRRQTFKFKVKTEDIVKTQVQVLRHLPVLLPDSASSLLGTTEAAKAVSDDPATEDQSSPCIWTRINSIYLDNLALKTYHTRLARDEGASALRYRWYGCSPPTGDSLAFVERKTHHEGWSGCESVKERLPVRWKDVIALLEGRFPASYKMRKRVARGEISMEQLETACTLADSFQAAIRKEDLKPCVRTKYWRSAFQDKDLRVTLDTAICLSNERPTSSADCSSGSSVLPFAILEVKVMQGELPEWVQKLVTEQSIEELPKYSKFLNACALFHTVQQLPHWFDNALVTDCTFANTKAPSCPPTPGMSLRSRRNCSQSCATDTRDSASVICTDGLCHQHEKREEHPVSLRARTSGQQNSDSSPAEGLPLLSAPLLSKTTTTTVTKEETHFSPVVRTEASLNALNAKDPLPRIQAGTCPPGVVPISSPSEDLHSAAAEGAKCDSSAVHNLGLRKAYTGGSEGSRLQAMRNRFNYPPPRNGGLVRIEPKTFFANERTLLQWLNFVVFLALLAVSLLTQKDQPGLQWTGAVVVGIAVFVALHSYFVYWRRLRSFQRREVTGYVDHIGPAILVPLIVGTLILTAYVTLTRPEDSDSTSLNLNGANASPDLNVRNLPGEDA